MWLIQYLRILQGSLEPPYVPEAQARCLVMYTRNEWPQCGFTQVVCHFLEHLLPCSLVYLYMQAPN